MKKRTVFAALIALCIALGGVLGAVPAGPDASTLLTPPAGELTVYPANGGADVPIGQWLEFKVELGGELLSYMDLTYEIVSGRDCAAIYYNGEILTLGEGTVTVRAFLDEDPSVEGFGSVRIVNTGAADKYNAVREPLSAQVQDAAFEEMIAGFPESYKPYLRALHEAHPTWIFRPFYTGVDFAQAVYNESLWDRSVTLLANFADVLKSKAAGDYDRETGSYILKDTGWVSATGPAIEHFMDPRCFLDETGIFQFELLTYDASVHTLEGIEGILAGSFMGNAKADYLDADGNLVSCDDTYAELILQAAENTGVNPYYLAAKIRQEIGSTPSDSANGRCAGYEGIYNFYNIEATDGEGNIERGLAWAGSGESYGRPWTSPARSILGGAEYIAVGYVDAGQFTGYLQKFNVNPDGEYELYNHQYMTNISGALSQAVSAYNGYAEIGALDIPLVFSIPVYENMPDTSNAAQAAVLGGTKGTAIETCSLRTGPAACYDPVYTLAAGDRVTLLRSVPTDAAYFQSWLFYPYWYEAEITTDAGEVITGYLAAEFVQPHVSRVVEEGQTVLLAPQLAPADCSDSLRWFSENAAVATVDADGAVTGVSAGTAVIVGYTPAGVFYETAVAVTQAEETVSAEE